MSTPKRSQTNLRNAMHSTGPKTEAGKKKSSQNALKHGLTGQIVVMPAEDQQLFDAHLQSFEARFDPQDALESHLVKSMAEASWRLSRVVALENDLLTCGISHDIGPSQGTVQQRHNTMEIISALATQAKALANLGAYSARISRQFERDLAQLRQLQETRQAQEKKDVNDYLDIVEMKEAKGEKYDPTEDGFVFTEDQINQAIQSRNREIETNNVQDYREEQEEGEEAA